MRDNGIKEGFQFQKKEAGLLSEVIYVREKILCAAVKDRKPQSLHIFLPIHHYHEAH
jgi:hypothetical protein